MWAVANYCLRILFPSPQAVGCRKARAKIGQFLEREGARVIGGGRAAVIEIDWVGRMGHPHPSSAEKGL